MKVVIVKKNKPVVEKAAEKQGVKRLEAKQPRSLWRRILDKVGI